MKIERKPLEIFILILAGLLVFAGLTYANYQFARENPGGNDFIPRWVGTRLFLLEGQNPYSDETSLAIQERIFGRAVQEGEDESLFVYPLYSVVVFAPFGLIEDFVLARALWMTVLQAALIGMATLTISLSRWRIPLPMVVVFLLFSLLWYHAVRPVINGNASILVAFFIALALWAVREDRPILAGLMLVLSTIKPQMVVLLVPFVLIWAIAGRHWRLVFSFTGWAVVFFGVFSLFVPDWWLQNLRQVTAYPEYTLPGTPGAILEQSFPGYGSMIGWGITFVMALILLVEWRNALYAGEAGFLWAAFLTLAVTNLIGIRTATANYIALFPALAFVFAAWEQRWERSGRLLSIITLVTLFFGLWWLFLTTVQPLDQPVQHPILFFPLPLILLAGLYLAKPRSRPQPYRASLPAT